MELLCISFAGMEACPRRPYTGIVSFLKHFYGGKVEKSSIKIVLPEK